MATFETFAAKCATTVAFDVLLGIASIESGVRPLAIRADGAAIIVSEAGAGVAMVLAASDKGREVGIGLLGLTEQQLASAGVSIPEAFEPCSNLRAGAAQFDRAAQDAMKRGLIGAAVEKSAIRSWWRPDGGYVSSEAYERAVQLARKSAVSLATKELGGNLPIVDAGRTDMKVTAQSVPRPPHRVDATAAAASRAVPPCWDVFARARFGAQC